MSRQSSEESEESSLFNTVLGPSSFLRSYTLCDKVVKSRPVVGGQHVRRTKTFRFGGRRLRT